MILNHVNLQVRDLTAALRWFATVQELKAGFHNDSNRKASDYRYPRPGQARQVPVSPHTSF